MEETEKNAKITNFKDLKVWQEGHLLVLALYKLAQNLPSKERFILVDQMLRAGLSITNNIAEGFSRKGKREKIQFYYVSKGSLTEVENCLLLGRDLKYYDKHNYDELMVQTEKVGKLLTGAINYLSRLS